MDIRIDPLRNRGGLLQGTVPAPPGKSEAHRLLICAGLAEGKSNIRGITSPHGTLSQDIMATIDCLRALGADIREHGDVLTVIGRDPMKAEPATLRCRESGSTLRFFIPICALSGRLMRLAGSSTLLGRPMSVYEELFRKSRLVLDREPDGIAVRGPLEAGNYTIDGSISSQFVSGLLFALPLARGVSTISLVPPVESRSYIDMTIEAMKKFGVRAEWTDGLTIRIPGDQSYRAAELTVEGDWSNAAFLLAMGADVSGLDTESTQGDKICKDYFRALDEGAAELDISDCPDLGPVLMAYAALRHGCRLTGTRRLRYKESDRGAAMKEELAKFRVSVNIEEDTIRVGCDAHTPSVPLDGHNDHRIVMALTVMCMRLGGTVRGAEAVSKSYPDFFDRLTELGVSIEKG